jgi:hypothetical protein
MSAQGPSAQTPDPHLPQRTAELRVMTDSPDIMSLRGFCHWRWGNPQTFGEKQCRHYRVATL